MTKSQLKIYAQAMKVVTEKFGTGGVTKLAAVYRVKRQMVSATIRGSEHNPSLRRKLKDEYGIECVPFKPVNPLRRKKTRPARSTQPLQKAA